MLKKFSVFFIIFLISLFSFTGCVQQKTTTVGQNNSPKVSIEKVYSGKLTGLSKKDHTLSLLVLQSNGAPHTVFFNLNEDTRGMGHAIKGKFILVAAKKLDGKLLATVIKPNFSGLMEGVLEISVHDVKNKLMNRKDIVLIDTRLGSSYEKSHLPKAISIPACTMEDHLDLLPENKERLLVFYCDDSTCGSSIRASAIAVESGYKKIRVLKAGLQGWIDEANKTVASDKFVLSGDCVLIDLRSEKDFFANRIRHALSIPFKSFDQSPRLQEISTQIPIVVYSDSIRESKGALAQLRGKEFHTVSMVEGNLQGWKKRGNALQTGPVKSQRILQRQIGAGEVSVQEFKKAVNGLSNAQIVDVRTEKEIRSGLIQGSIHIPLHEIAAHLDKLSRAKKIYLYCTAGARAEMARRFLVEQGFDAYFLLADIRCNAGKCTIKK